MPPAVGTGSGKESAASSDELSKHLDHLEELVHSIFGDLCDVKQQQQGLGMAESAMAARAMITTWLLTSLSPRMAHRAAHHIRPDRAVTTTTATPPRIGPVLGP
jgi:hypothetical protein